MLNLELDQVTMISIFYDRESNQLKQGRAQTIETHVTRDEISRKLGGTFSRLETVMFPLMVGGSLDIQFVISVLSSSINYTYDRRVFVNIWRGVVATIHVGYC
jgi:hypothetical protein